MGAAKPNKTIVELAQATPDLSTLVAAVVAGNLTDTLSSAGPLTVFAPTNDAFASLPNGTLDSLLKPENKDQLVDILLVHVLDGQVLSTDLKPAQVVPTVEGQSLTITAVGGIVQIISHAGSVAQVSTADVLASNGGVHIVNSVLLPGPALAAKPNKTIVELAQATPDLSTLVAAVVAGNLTDTLSGAGPFTVFAPTNDAFAKIPAADLQKLIANTKELDTVLEYHVLSGTFKMQE